MGLAILRALGEAGDKPGSDHGTNADQSEQRKFAGGVRHLHWSWRLVYRHRGCDRRHSLGLGGWLHRRLTLGHHNLDGFLLALFVNYYNGRALELSFRLNHDRRYRSMGHSGYFNRLRFVISKLLAKIVARIEPCAHRARLAGRSLPELERGLIGRFQAIVRDGQDGRDHSLLILLEDAHNMPVGK